MTSTTKIGWELGVDEARCRVPRRSTAPIRLTGSVLILMGGLVFNAPLFGILFFTLGQAPSWFAILGPLVVFGIFCFPAGGILMLWGLFLVAGHDEIIVQRGTVRAVSRWGPFWLSSRCPLKDLAGLRVESTGGGAESAGLQGLASLVALRRSGRRVYLLRIHPRHVIDELVPGLNQHFGRFAGREGIPWEGPLPMEEVTAHPEEFEDRSRNPTDSKVIVKQEPGRLSIELPSRGWWRSGSRFVTVWCFGWIGMTALFTAAFVPALLAEKVEGEPGIAWFLLAVFWTVGIVGFLFLWRGASRTGRILLTDDLLRFEEADPFGGNSFQWKTEGIESIVVGARRYETENRTYWKNFITVWPGDDKGRQWFNNRGKPELEWIVTTLRQALKEKPSHTMDG